MSYINNAIDTIQGIKTSFVDAVVTNEEIKKPLLSFIEAQGIFAKNVAKETSDFFTNVSLATFSVDLQKAFGTNKGV